MNPTPFILTVLLSFGGGYFIRGLQMNPQQGNAPEVTQTATLADKEIIPEVAASATGEKNALLSGGDGDTRDATKKKKKSNSMSKIAEMMDNPVMRETLTQQLRGQIAATYGQLFSDQGFNDEEIDALNDILAERQLALTDVSMELMAEGGFGDAKKMEAIAETTKKAKKEYDDQIKELLGDEKFNEFDRFEKTMGERQQIDTLRSQLADTNSPLSQDQEQRLMDIMWETRNDPAFSDAHVDINSPNAFPVYNNTDRALDKVTAMQEDIRKKSAAFLDADQIEALEKNQQSFRDMIKMAAEMSKSMFGGEAHQ